MIHKLTNRDLYFLLIFFFLVVFNYYSYADSNFHNSRLIVKFHYNSSLFYTLKDEILLNSKEPYLQNDGANFLLKLKSIGVTSVKPLINNKQINNLKFPNLPFFILEINTNVDLVNVKKSIESLVETEYVEYDFLVESSGLSLHQENHMNITNDSTGFPDDPEYKWQWWLENNGVPKGKPGMDINIKPAWKITKGSNRVLVAFLDTGMPHYADDSPEFHNRIVQGYDFVNNNNNSPFDDNSPYGHGSNIMSIATAIGDNNLSIAGIDWNCAILPVKVLDKNGQGYISQLIQGILFAIDKKANIINMSLTINNIGGEYNALKEVIDSAVADGVILIAAVGNNRSISKYYPAAYDEVISVGATNRYGLRADYFSCHDDKHPGSNYGEHLDFMAPGDGISGLNYKDPNYFSYFCGTSQATALVSGVVALMLSVNPVLNYYDIYDILRRTSRDTIGIKVEDSLGHDIFYGWGLIDAGKAVKYASGDTTEDTTLIEDFSYEDSNHDKVTFYPNPCRDKLSVFFLGGLQNDINFQIINQLGIIVIEKDFNNIDEFSGITLNMEELPTGNYFIRLSDSKKFHSKYFKLLIIR